MSLSNSTFSPAKINLFLKVDKKRFDGFHNIESRFQLINLFDEISIKKTNNKNISLRSNVKDKSFLNKNIILDAFFKLQEAVDEDLDLQGKSAVLGYRSTPSELVRSSSSKHMSRVYRLVKEAAKDMGLPCDGAVCSRGVKRIP